MGYAISLMAEDVVLSRGRKLSAKWTFGAGKASAVDAMGDVRCLICCAAISATPAGVPQRACEAAFAACASLARVVLMTARESR